MSRFPINRSCPISGKAYSRILTYLPADTVVAANTTYRPDFARILGISDNDEFPLVEGPSGFVFSGWLPPEDFLRRVYEDVIDHSKTITDTVEYRRVLLEFGSAFLRSVDKLRKSTKPLRMLDFGCGYGALTRMLMGRSIESFGYEPSPERSARASEYGIEVLHGLDEVARVAPFDLLICTEVLEHVADPRAVLRLLKRMASRGALAAISVPQCELRFITDSISALPRDHCLPKVINPWEHLNYFSANSLRRLLAEESFKVVNDFGRSRSAYDACFRVGEGTSLQDSICNGLRVMKRSVVTSLSTELICQVE